MRQTDSPVFHVWQNMRRRCYKPTNEKYQRYGARGITVCDRWNQDFWNFHNDMIGTWQKGLQLDRRNNDGNYEPANCHWTTCTQNNRNRSCSKLTSEDVKLMRELLGHGWSLTKTAALFAVDRSMVTHIKGGRTWREA